MKFINQTLRPEKTTATNPAKIIHRATTSIGLSVPHTTTITTTPPPSTPRRALPPDPLRLPISSIQKEKPPVEPIKPIASIRTESDHEKELANLTKLYTNEATYSGENDSFSFKLTIFHDMCNCADVSQSAKLKAFLIMLKDLALDYYYSNMSTDVSITFDEVCFSMRNYFEGVEYRSSILFK
jgi:hypothetical protein